MNPGTDQHIGSNFDDLLAGDGLLAEVEVVALKRVITFQLKREMKRMGLTRVQLALKMDASFSAVDRLLDPENHAVTLKTLERAADVLGKRLRFELI